MTTTRRLIESWLPIAALGVESLRERTPMTPFPAPNRLHVWWARRPLVASRAAVMASLLPADADHDKFMHMLGIHGDPVAAKVRIAKADRDGIRLGSDAYGYPRAFGHCPDHGERVWWRDETRRAGVSSPVVLDPTAGGGSIPFEASRVGASVLANDLNPVAATILEATIRWPWIAGPAIQTQFDRLGSRLATVLRQRMSGYYPPEGAIADFRPDAYLWARTITCPYCDGLIPLSPNWRLAPNGTGVRLLPNLQTRRCDFAIVQSAKDHSEGTVSDGDAKCPFSDCNRVVDGDEVKRQAQAGQMGEQLYTVVYKQRVLAGKREKWQRGYRAPRPEDDVSEQVAAALAEKLPEWEALGVVPTEEIPDGLKTTEPHRYGMVTWRDLFSARQLLGHGTSVEVFRELVDEARAAGTLDEATKAAFVYLSFALDKILNWNAILSSWNVTAQTLRSVFDRHDYAVKWSFAEMAPCITGLGYDWAIEQTGKCVKELIELTQGGGSKGKRQVSMFDTVAVAAPPITVTCGSGDDLTHVANASVDAVVMDPPYYDNVMYAELSDFFYVWLKRTAGYVAPEFFTRRLTDKESEAVANPAKFRDQKGAKKLAGIDYQERMARIFAECRRVLKADGVLTVMFTHKATGAWDALTSGLMEAGFTITASWPINTEAEGSLHIKDKSAANSTIFLVCRPRPDAAGNEAAYWEDVEPLVRKAVQQRIPEFEAGGIRGVDLYLSCFGPALQEFAAHWPMRRGQPLPPPSQRSKKRQAEMLEEWDPYAVTPEDALLAARREVKRWRMERLTRKRQSAEMDALTEWFVLAWDAFAAPVFPYDEALRLARVVGLDLDQDVVGRVAEKKASDVVLWDSARRAAKGALGSADGSRSMLDALHHAAYTARSKTLQAAADQLQRVGTDRDPAFFAALAAVLEVLPIDRSHGGYVDASGPVADAASDFEVLENLRRLAYSEKVAKPEQLELAL